MDSRVGFGSMVRSIVLPLLGAAVVLVAVRSMATTLAGGGMPPDGNALNADCFVYADVAGTHATRLISTSASQCPKNQPPPCFSAKYLDCADGDPTCDQDATCNGVCVFKARICLGLPAKPATNVGGKPVCIPPPSLDSLKLNHRCPLPPPATLQGSACGAFVTFNVRRSTKLHPRRQRCTAHATAPTSVSGRVDNDVYVFKCLPCASSPSAAILQLTRGR